MTEKCESASRSGREEGVSSARPNAADEIPILDYVMIDFVDDSFATRADAQLRAQTEP